MWELFYHNFVAASVVCVLFYALGLEELPRNKLTIISSIIGTWIAFIVIDVVLKVLFNWNW